MLSASPLFLAIERNDAMAVRRLLIARPECLDARDETHTLRPFAIHAAAARGYPVVLRALVNAGAVLDVLDGQGSTALGLAAVFGHLAIAADLLSGGADPNIRNDLGFTPLAAAVAGAQGKWRHCVPVPEAVWEEIVELLVRYGAIA